MTNKAIIRAFIPDLISAVQWEKQDDWYAGGHFVFYRINRASSLEPIEVCLLKISGRFLTYTIAPGSSHTSLEGYQLQVTDAAPVPFWDDTVRAMEDCSGLYVAGCFFVGSGEVLRRDDARLVDGRLSKECHGEVGFSDGDVPYYLYLLR